MFGIQTLGSAFIDLNLLLSPHSEKMDLYTRQVTAALHSHSRILPKAAFLELRLPRMRSPDVAQVVAPSTLRVLGYASVCLLSSC